MSELKIDSILAQIGNRSCSHTGAVNPPIYFSTAYAHNELGHSTGYDYSRTNNPTREILEKTIAKLENGSRGFACSSGMAAIQTILSLFSTGDEIIVSSDLYGGTYRLFETVFSRFGIRAIYVDTSVISEIQSSIGPMVKAIFVETPTNPLMKESDIRKIAQVAKKQNLLVIVDNTFYTPLLQQPLNLGADIVIHSATKYLGGHNDVLAGLIICKDEELGEKIGHIHNGAGAVLSPMDSWLLMRGMKTLALRMNKHQENALKVAEFLKNHDFVEKVFYPDKGGMLSFKLAEESAVNCFLKSLKLIYFAESLGGTESFITYPATQTHADIPFEIRNAIGVCNKLLRFSVGIEHHRDIVDDLTQALRYAKKGVK